MRKLLAVLLLVSAAAFGQTKTTVTGVVQDASGNLATSGTVVFNLSPQNSGIIYFVTGTGIIAPQTGTCGIDGSGNIKNLALSGACQVWGTDLIQPANLTYQVAFFPNGVGSPTNTVAQQCITGVTYDLSNPKFCPVIKPTPQGATVITSPIQNNLIPSADAVFSLGSASLRYANVFSSSGTFTNMSILNNLSVAGTVTASNIPPGVIETGTGTTNTIPKFTNGAAGIQGNSSVTDNGTTVSTSEAVSLGSTLGVTGKITNSNWNSVRIVDGTTIQTIQACINALPALGGTCLVPPLDPVSGEYLETLTANIVLKKNTVLQFLGQCQITLGAFNIQIPQGADDVSIITPFAHSSDQAGNAQGCALVGYTGSTAAVDTGSSAGFTYNTSIRGLHVNLFSAQAGAVGFRRTNGVSGPLEYNQVVFGPVSGQIGFQFVGTGANFDGTSNIIGPECNSSPSATNNKCLQWTGTNQNGYAMLGGHANMGGSANGSVCLDAAAGTSRVDPGGFYCDVAATALTVESTTNTAVKGNLWADSGVTLFANFAAGTNGSRIDTNTRSIGTQLVTDTSGQNSVTNGFDYQTNSRLWRMNANSTAWQLLDGGTNAAHILSTPGTNGQLRLSASGSEQLYFNFDGGQGATFYDGAANPKLQIDQNGTPHPSVVNTIGLGTVSAPFLDLRIGAAATNNIRILGTATAARVQTLQDATGTVPLIIASGTSTFTTTAVGAGACQTTVTTAATNTLTTDTITVSYASAPGAATDSLLILNKWPTAGNVNFSRCNPTAASITPTALVLNWRVIR